MLARTLRPCTAQPASLCTTRTSFYADPATPEIYTLSLHDALPIYWHVQLGRKLLAAEGAVIGEQQHALPVRFQPPDAGKQLFEIVRQLVPRDGAGSFVLFDDVRLALGRGWLRPARHIDRQATSDRHHPGERGRTGWIVVASIAPDPKIVLHVHLARHDRAAQDPHHDTVAVGA